MTNADMAAIVAPLFQPFTVKNVTLKNRIVMSPMTRAHSPDGVPGEDVAAYYRRRAEGEVGLIITEGVGTEDLASTDNLRIPVLREGAPLKGWKRVVDEVHAGGAKIFPQLWHQGVLRDARISAHPELLGRRPSGLWGPLGHNSLDPAYVESVAAPTVPMTEAEIAHVIETYARSAGYAKALGFDGIAIHAGHGYLIDSFFWGETNTRTDKWGGDRRGRTRFGVEVVKAIRAAIGPSMPIMYRFSQHKTQDYAARLADTPRALEDILVPLAEAGVDVFDASTRKFELPAFDGSPLNLAGWAKKVTGKPSMMVGSVGLNNTLPEMWKAGSAPVNNIPAVMERFNRGDFDLVAVGRSLLADPGFARRVRLGEPFVPFDKSVTTRLT